MYASVIYVVCLSVIFRITASETCEPLTIPICQNIGYTETMVPNVFGHTKQEDAATELHKYFPLLQMKCSPDFQELFCAFYAPKCILENPDEPVLVPTRQQCEQVQNDCASALMKYGLTWPKDILCNELSDEIPTSVDVDKIESPYAQLEPSKSKYQLFVKYSPGPLTFTSCCKVYSVSQKVFFLPSEADVQVRSADVRSSSIPKVTWKGTQFGLKRKGYTTLVMVTGYTETKDSNSEPLVYTNWVVTNIRNGDVSKGITIKEYEGPHPESNTDNRVYFLLYQHSKPLKLSPFVKYNNPENSRYKTDLDSLTRDNKMVLVSSKYMLVEIDDYSRYRSVSELGRAEAEVCQNVPGYPRACRKRSLLYNVYR